MAQLCALRTHDVRALFSLERLSSAALFQETMVCSLGNKKNPAQNAVPASCTRIPVECSAPASGTTQVSAAQTHRYQTSGMEHQCITFPWNRSCFLSVATVVVFSLLIFSIRRRVSVMKGSVLIQDREIMCWSLEDYKTVLLLMS